MITDCSHNFLKIVFCFVCCNIAVECRSSNQFKGRARKKKDRSHGRSKTESAATYAADDAYANIDITYARAIDPDIRFTLRPSAPSQFVGSCL